MTTYGIIYVVTNTINGKQYVGQTTKSLEKRWSGHTSGSVGHCRALWGAIRKYGKESFTLTSVDVGSSKIELDHAEMRWVERLNTVAPNGYNLTIGGGSVGKHSLETIEKRRQTLMGHPTAQKTRDKIRDAQKGRSLSPAHKEALRVPKKNRTEEGIESRKEAIRNAYARMTQEKKSQFGQHRVGTKHSEETLAKMRMKAQARASRRKNDVPLA